MHETRKSCNCDIVLLFVTVGSDYLKIVNLAETQSVALGDSAILSCSVLFANTVYNYVTWSRNGSRYRPIEEDPFCVGQTASSMFDFFSNGLRFTVGI